ncbi:hypothetical protein ACFP1Z_32395 [Streptomyces gamaensis]|uniref:Type II toxin-antitoxin system RelE/ParE family toxin n=1 Tax=Streptomyces gamaensis TaxID=1763542 RepID=A0ABW0Z7Q4_9ACTN
MSDWQIVMPARLNEEMARLTPSGRRAVHDALAALARDPQTGAEEVIAGAEIRRHRTQPTADTGDRISVLYRVHARERRIEVIYLIAGP